MKVVVQTIFSFMLTSWTYSEVMLIFPEIEPITEKVIETLQIPTHDKWRVYYDLEYREDVTNQINSFLVSTGLNVEANQLLDSKEFIPASHKTRYLEIPKNEISDNLTPLFENASVITPAGMESLFEYF